MKIVLTCEHAGNAIPDDFASYFKTSKHRLGTHEGYDLGAFEVYKSLEPIAVFSSYYPWSRLLIEVNRSLHHPQLFSSISNSLSKKEKHELIEDYYKAYRHQIQNKIEGIISKGDVVLHLSIHSFTPVLQGQKRKAELGILYDPAFKSEKEFAQLLKRELKLRFGKYTIRMNYPYLGKADGFTTYLRTKFPKQYKGIELEINQKIAQDRHEFENLKSNLLSAITSVLGKN